jgi:Rrf2 family protein
VPVVVDVARVPLDYRSTWMSNIYIMRLSQGVEWAVHALLNLAWAATDCPVPTAALAAGHDHPPAYLNKQLQRLVKAGLLTSEPGAKGGFRLARGLESITLLDVVDAIEGPDPLFRCREIRQCGTIAVETSASDFTAACAVKTAMIRAQSAWRAALGAQTLAAVRAEADAHAPEVATAVHRALAR